MYSTCGITFDSDTADMLRNCSLIIWDEVPMIHRHAFEAFDRSLRDIREANAIFGNLTMLFCGDFRQVLPVIPGGSPSQSVFASLKYSRLWPSISQFHLTRNLRVRGDDTDFSEYLLRIGNGTEPSQDGRIEIADNLLVEGNDIEALIQEIYPNFEENFTEADWLSSRVILAPRNTVVDDINDHLSSKIPGEYRVYKSVDSVQDPDTNANLYQVEFLNSLSRIPGIAPHELKLKVGMPVMLMRNLSRDLANGTRMVIRELGSHVIKAEITQGKQKGKIHLIQSRRAKLWRMWESVF